MRIPAILFFCMTISACSGQPQVQVGDQVLLGEFVENSRVAAFKGVPFAEPPLGDLRWRKPQPLRTSATYRQATDFAPACMQSPRILEWYRDLAETFGASRQVFEDLLTSEDCLYLDIWSADLRPNAELPVMVYIHGGSNNSGWPYEPNYRGQVLAERGVVIVSIAYRLGVFGFLSHPDLSDQSAIANFGLWDQIAALRWIRENIQQFGGNPKKVTVFGESAGAQDILALMASEKSAGLFQGAILQSTAGFGIGHPPTLIDEQKRGIQTAQLFDFDGPDALQQLKSVPAEILLHAYEKRFAGYYHAPAVDGQILKRPVWDVLNEGDLANVPIIIGSNADEWYDSTPDGTNAADVEKAIESSQFLNSRETLAEVHVEADYREAIDRIATAENMLCPSQYLASKQTTLHGNAWMYYFSRVRDGDAGTEVRAYHGAELPYVFGTHDPWMTTTVVDWKLSDQIIAYWIQFAKTGNPNATDLPAWPVYTTTGNPVLEFADELSLVPAPEPVLCRVFRASVSR